MFVEDGADSFYDCGRIESIGNRSVDFSIAVEKDIRRIRLK